MRDDLREVELRRHARVQQVADLGLRVRVRVGPAAERQPVLVAPNPFAQLPRVLDASRRADVPIAAEDHQRLEAVLPRAIGVGQAVLVGVLARQERDDVRARARRCRDW